jgi:two-component system, NtrC family, sensor kinase
MRQPGGIRSKITFCFCLLLTFMVGNSIITYGIVQKVEEKLFNVELVDDFLENTLEVRRMEKNFLLYGDRDSLNQGIVYLENLFGHLAENKELFDRLTSSSTRGEVSEILKDYTSIFSSLRHPVDSSEAALQVRDLGNQLTVLAEDLVAMERGAINTLLRMIRNALLLFLPFFILFFGTVAAFLGRGIVSSLKQLERHAAIIATGNFVEVPFTGTNREVNSVISAFNRMSRELKSRQQQLVQSEKLASLGTMLAGVAHEVNNPLSNISSSAQILAEEIENIDDSLAHEMLDQINSETSRASSIIKTLLTLARQENFFREHHKFEPMLKEIIVLLHGQMTKDVDIQLTIPKELTVFADKQKIQQVFLNLLKNSMDAMGGRGIIKIRAWQYQSTVKIVIKDNGPGVPIQIQEKIFDPFFTTKDTGQGAGLGLFIVYDIIAQHGGTITVENLKAEGASFTIVLPN